MNGPEIKNAVIESVKLSFADRGFLDCWVQLDYGGTGQGFGGFILYIPQSWAHYKLESVAGHFLFRVMEIAGVEDFERLEGRTIRVKADHGKIYAIGHIVKEDWFDPTSDFAALKERA